MYVPPPPPVPIVSLIINIGIGCLIIALIIRAVATWVHLDERVAFIRICSRLTDPFIGPLRRIVGRVWIIDIAFFVSIFLLLILRTLFLQSIPPGW